MEIRKVSLVGFYNDKNEILLQERGDYSKSGEEWGFFGGGIEESETALEAFYREAKEELGLDMNDFDYKYLGEFIFEHPEYNVKIYRNIFLIKTDLKETDFTVYEGAGAKFFNIEDAKNLKFPTGPSKTLEIIKDYLLGKQ